MLTECQQQWTTFVTARVTNYGTLLTQITVAGFDAACFVTFNYDTLFEEALTVVGITINHLDDYVANPAFKIVKPHGSLNWAHEVPNVPSNVISSNSRPVASQWLLEHAEEISPRPEFRFLATPVYAVDGGVALWPSLALPVATKSDFACPPPQLEALKKCLPKVTKVLTIGWRGAEQHFLRILDDHLPPVPGLVVGKDPSDAQGICATLAKVSRERWRPAGGGFTESLVNREIQRFLAL